MLVPANEYYNEAQVLEEEDTQRRVNSIKNKIIRYSSKSIRIHPVDSMSADELAVTDDKLKSFSFHSKVDENSSDLSNEHFSGVETIQHSADSKRDMIYRNALANATTRTIHYILFFGFLFFSITLLVVGFAVAYVVSVQVSQRVNTVIDACAPVSSITNIIVAVRTYQILQMSGSILNTTADSVSDIYTNLSEIRNIIGEFKLFLVNLQQVGYDGTFSSEVYSQFHQVYYRVSMPTVIDNEMYYNSTSFENATITDITNMVIEYTDQILSSSETQMLQTLANYQFMVLYLNQEIFTTAFNDFCGMYMATEQNTALNDISILTIFVH